MILLTKGPVWHWCRPADELCILLDHHLRRRSGEKVKIENSSNCFVGYSITSIHDVHAITVQQQNTVCSPHWNFAAVVRQPDVHVEGVRPIQIHIEVGAADVGVPKRQRLVLGELESLLGVLSQAVKGGAEDGEGWGDLEILVLEYQEGACVWSVGWGVEEDVAGGATADDKAEWGGFAEREDEVWLGVGDYVVFRRDVVVFRRDGVVLREHSAVELGVTGKDFLGDFPSLVLGIGDSNSETIIRFQTAEIDFKKR